MKVRICAFKHSLVPRKKEKRSIKQHLPLQRRNRVCQMCGWWCVLLLCGCVCPRIAEDDCVFSHPLQHHQISHPSRLWCCPETLGSSLKRLPRTLHVNQMPSGCLSRSCRHSQFTHSDETNVHRYLSKAEVAQASLSKAQREGGSVRLVTKEQFFPQRSAAASPPASHRWGQSYETFSLFLFKT